MHSFPKIIAKIHLRSAVARLILALCVTAGPVGCASKGDTGMVQSHDASLQNVQDVESWQLSAQAQADFAYLMAQDFLRQGNGREAQRALKLALNLHPTPRLYLELAEVQWRMGEAAEARQTLKLGLTQHPEDRQLLISLVDAYIAAKRNEDAATTLEIYLKDHPGDVELLHKLTQVHLAQKAFVEALQTLTRVPKELATDETMILRAQANAGLGLTDKAIGQLRSVLAEDPENVLALAELAYLYEIKKDYLRAERTYGRILELGETSSDVWIRLINANLKLNNPDRALTLAQQGPQNTAFILDVARLFIADGFYDQAKALLEPMAATTPQPPEVVFFQALIAFEGDKDTSKAIDYLASIGPDSPNYGRALLFRAQLLLSQKRYDETLKAAQEGRHRFPDDRDFVEVQAWALQDQGKNAEAAAILEEALQQWPGDVDMLYRIGVLREELGQRSKAIEAMESIISMNPNHAEALNFVAYLLAEEGRDLDRALGMATLAMKEKPDSGFIVDTLAWIHFKRGDLDQAWRDIRRAVSLVDDDPTVWEHYGDIAAALGLKDRARKGYRRALELGTEHADRVRGKLKSL